MRVRLKLGMILENLAFYDPPSKKLHNQTDANVHILMFVPLQFHRDIFLNSFCKRLKTLKYQISP